MKSFIDKIFRKRKSDAEQIEENKKVLAEQIETAIKNKIAQDEATEAAVEAIIEEVKKEEVVIYPQPNHFSGCNCFKCVRWKNQNAK
jgi:fumarylacetoacetate (FAA) hydrolase family protein